MLQTGSALLTVPAASAAGDFAVEFDTYFGGGSGSGGEGLSFSFGALPPTHFGEHGVSSALSIQLLSAEKRIEIWHAHSILAQTVGSVELRRGSFTQCLISFELQRVRTLLRSLRPHSHLRVVIEPDPQFSALFIEPDPQFSAL